VRHARARLGTPADGGPDVRVGDASHLPWPTGSFDIVHQGTVFTSILDDEMRRSVAREMLRVLKPGGVIAWYDFFVNNPNNAAVRGVGRGEIEAMFSGCHVRLKRVTLAPPLARHLVSISWTAALTLESLALLNTHYLGIIRRPDITVRS